MIHAICDFCGKDCRHSATFLQLTAFSNFARFRNDDHIYGRKENTKNFVICSKCLDKHDLPNPYLDYHQVDIQDLDYRKTVDNYKEEDRDKDNKMKLEKWKLLNEVKK